MMLLDQWQQAVTHIRHPEERARPLPAARASKGDGRGRASFEALAIARRIRACTRLRLGHLRMTGIGECLRLLALLVTCVLASAALAQPPFVPDDWKFGKRQEPNTLHYC